jgi:hypothetical protein
MKFKERYQLLQRENINSATASTVRPVKQTKTRGLLRITDSDDSDSTLESDSPEPSSEPWMVEFDQYIKTNDIMPAGMSVVAWWGVRILISKPYNILNH